MKLCVECDTDKGPTGTRVFIDDVEVLLVRSIAFQHSVGSLPSFWVQYFTPHPTTGQVYLETTAAITEKHFP